MIATNNWEATRSLACRLWWDDNMALGTGAVPRLCGVALHGSDTTDCSGDCVRCRCCLGRPGDGWPAGHLLASRPRQATVAPLDSRSRRARLRRLDRLQGSGG